MQSGMLDQRPSLDAMEGFAFSLFEKLRTESFDGVGITREAYAASETAAHDRIAHIARQEGLQVEQDPVKNLIIALPGKEAEKPFVACGSHLDSVPQGGNFDGGVVAALTAVVHLRHAGVVPPRTVKVFIFRAEESAWFGKSWLGSNAMFGLLTQNDLSAPRSANGQTLGDAMMGTGADCRVSRASYRARAGHGRAGLAGGHRHRDLWQRSAHAHSLPWSFRTRWRSAALNAARCRVRGCASHRAA
jgi:Peptidase family M28